MNAKATNGIHFRTLQYPDYVLHVNIRSDLVKQTAIQVDILNLKHVLFKSKYYVHHLITI